MAEEPPKGSYTITYVGVCGGRKEAVLTGQSAYLLHMEKHGKQKFPT